MWQRLLTLYQRRRTNCVAVSCISTPASHATLPASLLTPVGFHLRACSAHLQPMPTRSSILLQHHYQLSFRQPDTLPGFASNKRQNAVFSFFLLLQHSYQLPFRHSTKSVLACACACVSCLDSLTVACACVCVSCLDSLTVAWPAVEQDLMTAYRIMNGSCESHMDHDNVQDHIWSNLT